MNRLLQLPTDLAAILGRLSPRELRLTLLTAATLALLSGLLIYKSVSSALYSREARISTKTKQLQEISSLTSGYRASEARRNDLERRLRNNPIRLFSYLDDLSKKLNIQIGGLSDKGSHPMTEGSKVLESSVEVVFTRVPLDKLVSFLNQVEESQGPVKITRLQMKPRKDEEVFDAWMVVTTYNLEG